MKLKGADILINCILEQGVDTVFGYPGGAVLDIYDALYRNGKINHILTAHEQGAAHAADGYARVTGKTGVCFATSGPGATNLVTGIATAYMDSVPMVAITGNVGINFLGRDSFQEIDICGATIPVTKHNFIVKDVNELADTVRKAFFIAGSGRKGPVLVDILKNVQTDECDYSPEKPLEFTRHKPDAESIKKAAEAINRAERPVIIAGGGVIAADAADELSKLAQKIGSPVTYTLMGKGCMPENSCLGMVGMHGTSAAAKAVLEADAVIALGTRFSDRVALNREKFAYGKKVIHIDIDSAEIDKNITSSVHVVADLKSTLEALLPLLEKRRRKEWLERAYSRPKHAEKTGLGQRTIAAASKLAPAGSPLITDVGQHQMWAAQHYEVNSPRLFCTSGGLGTMGYGLGAAIGAAIGTGKTGVLVTGDGCFGMNMNELMTAASRRVPLVILLMNNRVLGMVRQWQKIFYSRRFSQTTLERNVDYIKLAESLGAKGIAIENEKDIESVLKYAFKTAADENIPVLVDCRISSDENVLPMIKPNSTYETQLEDMEN